MCISNMNTGHESFPSRYGSPREKNDLLRLQPHLRDLSRRLVTRSCTSSVHSSSSIGGTEHCSNRFQIRRHPMHNSSLEFQNFQVPTEISFVQKHKYFFYWSTTINKAIKPKLKYARCMHVLSFLTKQVPKYGIRGRLVAQLRISPYIY